MLLLQHVGICIVKFGVTILALMLVVAGNCLRATTMCVLTMEQPINLGAKANPSRIPLGPVVVETNHGYSRHVAISFPRACGLGALDWEQGRVLDMNLASVFGIEVRPLNELTPLLQPVRLVIKDWKIPAYSPYRKDQVVAAVIHCLLRSVGTTPETPLRIVIQAENPDDARDLARFSGNYFSAFDKKSGGPTQVPGTHLACDNRGVTWVVFSEAKAPSAAALSHPPPAIIPMSIRDESDGGGFFMIPVWAGDDLPSAISLYERPATLFYDLFEPRETVGPDINFLTRKGVFYRAGLKEWRGAYQLELLVRREPTEPRVAESICAALYAAVLTTQPTERMPLHVSVGGYLEDVGGMEPFIDDKEWTHDGSLRCKLVWSSSEGKLTSGSIPLGTLKRTYSHQLCVDFGGRDYLPTAVPFGQAGTCTNLKMGVPEWKQPANKAQK